MPSALDDKTLHLFWFDAAGSVTAESCLALLNNTLLPEVKTISCRRSIIINDMALRVTVLRNASTLFSEISLINDNESHQSSVGSGQS